MAEFFDELISCIRADDVKTFRRYEEERELHTIRMGRFPVLSVVYLFDAKKIASYCEQTYIKANSWKEEREPYVLSYAFSKAARRTLRLYLNEIVSPLEMLLILDKTQKVKRLYPLARPSQAQKARLVSVWSVLHSLSVTFTSDGIVIEKRPLTSYEKRRALLSAFSVLLCVALIVATPFCVNVFYPFINVNKNSEQNNNKDSETSDTDTENQEEQKQDETVKYYFASTIDDIDFASNNVYTLTQDIVMPENFYCENMSCTLKGNEKTINLPSSFPLFGTITGTLENVNFSFSVDTVLTQSTALVAATNEGRIEKVNVSVAGNARFEKGESESETSVTLAGLVSTNTRDGKILSCNANLSLSLIGQTEANGVFAGICSTNNGEIGSCTSSGTLTSDTVDVAGICNANTYYLHDCVNTCDITQSISVLTWNPICAGIALSNDRSIQTCRNEGNVTVVSSYRTEGEWAEDYTFASAIAAGIVSDNHYAVDTCENTGKITISAVENVCYAAGIAAKCRSTSSSFFFTSLYMQNCTNDAEISVTSEKITSFVGGIVAYATDSAQIFKCENRANGKINASIAQCDYKNAFVCAAGIGANADGCSFSTCINAAPITVNAVIPITFDSGIAARSGSIASCSNTGSISVSGSYSTSYIGGVAGNASGSVSASSSSGKIIATGDELFLGGIAGNSGSVSTCNNASELEVVGTSKTAYVGGVVGSASGTVTGSSSASNILAQSDTLYLGGITSLSYYTVSKCYNEGTLSATGKNVSAGGILGYSPLTVSGYSVYYGKVSDCVSAAHLTVQGTETSFGGGIIGHAVDWSYERKDQSGGTTVTYFGATVDKTFFLGSVTGENAYLGSVIGGCGSSIFTETDESSHFTDVYVLSAEPVAVGAVTADEETYEVGGSVTGVVIGTLEELQANEAYTEIMKNFPDLLSDSPIS